MLASTRKSLCLAALLLSLANITPTSAQTTAPVVPNATETKAQRDKRMKWWREARFGMFIHWGLYAVPAGEWNGKTIGGASEWIMNSAKIPVADYAALAPQFNPVKFDAEAWAQLAQNAGMKYVVITSKHHDGFAMFPSQASPFNIYSATPFKRDPLAELAAACRKRGIKFGLYYSQAQDWHHPGGAAYGNHWDKAQEGDLHQYVRTVAAPQVREVLARYKPSILWWDTPVDMSPADIAALTADFAQHPNIITNNRLGNGVPGDTETPEQTVPATGLARDWETCMTMNYSWGYKKEDINWKSTDDLLHNLVDIASKGGNFLLNVGPTAEGIIPQPSVERLTAMGTWLRTNGESVYGTGASPFKKLSWGRATTKPGTIYLHVFNWPQNGKLVVPGLKNKVVRAQMLSTRKAVPLARNGDDVVLSLPALAPDKINTVVVLRIAGAPDVVPFANVQAVDGSLKLHAVVADLHGETLRYEEGNGKDNIGFWINANDWVSWDIDVKHPGTFNVEVTYAADQGNGDSEYSIVIGDEKLAGKVNETGSWTTFAKQRIGTIKVAKAGRYTLAVKPTKKVGGGVMNLQSIVLKPKLL